CCMHKDWNATRGGAESLKAWWKSNPHIQGPILLANKDNVATLSDASSIAAETNPSERRALAGALFNHSNDKKGLSSRYAFIFFESIKVGRSTRFLGTSTTRYGSILDAAAELITYLSDYIRRLEVRDKKEKMNFNHLEQNIYEALHEPPTITERCAMILYALAISYPYVSRVRGPGTEYVNLLDLDPFHQEVKAHVSTIIENPDILLAVSSEVTRIRAWWAWEHMVHL
ncbi:hypothetical protein B0H13DRAFT_1641590, partial [Mycena leptocephala]